MTVRLDAHLLATLEALPGEALPDIEIQSLRDELERPWSRVWVRVEGRSIVSVLVTWFVADEVHVINISTAPSQQRKGHARALFEVLQNEARAAHARIMVLEVRVGNAAAIALYLAFGFEATGVRKAYYRDGEDALDMVRVLAHSPTPY